MFDIMTDIGVNRNYDFSKYDINTFDGDIMLQGLSKDLIDKAWNKYQDYKTNKTQYFVGSDIINDTQEGKNYYCASCNRRIWWLSKHFLGGAVYCIVIFMIE